MEGVQGRLLWWLGAGACVLCSWAVGAGPFSVNSRRKWKDFVEVSTTSRRTLEKTSFRGVVQKDKGSKVLGCNK